MKFRDIHVLNPNWPSHYTYYGRYEDTGVTDRALDYVAKTGKKYLKILDVGCSVGLPVKSMKKILLDSGIIAEVIGNDISAEVQERAKENLDDFILGDILKINLIPDFDLVICSKMIFRETAKRKTAVLSKCQEALKSDGGLITDADAYSFPTIMTQIKEDISDARKILWKLRSGPKASYLEIKRISEFRFKRKIVLIMGKDEVSKYPLKILAGWKKLTVDAKFSFFLDVMLGKIIAHSNKQPDYKKRGKGNSRG